MVRLGNDSLVAGSKDYLYLLNSSLGVISSRTISPVNRMLLIIDVPEVSGEVVLACQSDECSLHSSGNFSIVHEVDFDIVELDAVLLGGDRGVFSVMSGGSIFVARPNYEPAQVTSSISKLSYSFSESTLDISLTGSQEETDRFQERTFMTRFIYGGFIYYVFYLQLVNLEELRIARHCLDDSGGSSNSLTTYTEAHLQCDTAANAVPTAATFLELNGEPFILLAMKSLVDSSNRICLFNLTEIDQKMDDKLTSCANGNGQLDLQRNSRSNCPMLDQSQIDVGNSCNITSLKFSLGHNTMHA